mmetsp:Transcript_14310/g.23234  ORF Transcript_14310/g.23234 Transcript_14310/m.23234 type:complete len:547 (+) Transcript_14310:337-1977(+)|eukprot:CAMPEP_0171496896 /NCGR_PEP_ID=MMETSP0958-20121227/6960_1 /TAXON_ID=87120 /ORGANISM="Aurantiochytrium limacinum, Strain ATCCMYA-1381" /LENGTH=546 /DNA_ID=CAMNT_0012031057 /DNA_START=329 /DNA_END=1969 /DNA_ORIENTATION=+
MKIEVKDERVQWLQDEEKIVSDDKNDGPIVYWMHREKRADDNWALLKAQSLAFAKNATLAVVLFVPTKYMYWNQRHYSFLLKGLGETQKKLHSKNIPMHVTLSEQVPSDLVNYCKKVKARALVMDFFPMRPKRNWDSEVVKQLDIPICMVDAHNVIPCWETSDKREYAARTIRSKINRRKDEFLEDFPEVQKMPSPDEKLHDADFDGMFEKLKSDYKMDTSVEPVNGIFPPGPSGARKTLEAFLDAKRLGKYDRDRNDPNAKAVSNMSPYMNYGFIAPQRVILDAEAYAKENKSIPSSEINGFVEECLVRRELADNYCHFEPKYDSLEAAYEWARETLEVHKKDKRPHIYSFEELAEARTNDELWNAAQVMAREEGKMHGWLRMYWAKQLLIWTETPEEALDYGLRLNDIYNLDGGDPNSVVGVGWSIMGIHDQGWKEREIFGKIRCMTYKSSRTKFDVDKLARAYPGPGASSGKGNDSSSGEKKKKDNENKKKVTSKKEKKEDKPETNKQNSKRKSSSKDENGDDSKSKSSKSTGRTKKKAKKAE